MKTIKVAIKAVNDGEVAVAIIQYQRKRGDTWVAEKSVTLLSDQPESERSILLDDDQRLIIEGQSNMQLVMNKEQAMAQYVADPGFPDRFRPTPPDRDGEEKDTPDLVKEAQRPDKLKAAQAEEARAAAISSARTQARNQSHGKEEKK